MKFSLKLLCLACAISANLNAQEWQDYSMPDDTSIFHKMCKFENAYWAIDYGNGRIFNSQNDGKEWRLQYESPGEFLEAIQFLDQKTGYLCGDYGVVMKSEDGGASWKDIAPKYAPRITKTNPMEKDSTAIKRYYYGMYFKNKNQGLLWGFEIKPLIGWRKSQKSFFYQTKDGGDSWERIAYSRKEYDSIIYSFLEGAQWEKEVAFGLYEFEGRFYKVGRQNIKISKDNKQSWESYPIPPLPENRFMLRTVHFVSEHQGYIFGGDLKEESQGYILETLDGGQSWRMLETDFPHLHYSLQTGKEILLSGKEKLLKKWTPKAKADSSFLHRGDASRILIDGLIKKREWSGANKTKIKEGIDLYTLQDDHYLYLSVQYDTARYANYYCDLYVELGKDSLLNIHASQQLGERILQGKKWTDSEPPFQWGYISDWTANAIKFDRKNKEYIPYQAIEFQIAKSKLPKGSLKIALQSRDFNLEKEIVNFPKGTDFKSTKDWLLLYLE